MSSISGRVDFTSEPIVTLTSYPVQPSHDSEAGLVLVIDGRIDAELLLQAYRRWGDSCPVHILGEYAFAVWDQTKQRLFCARDSGGVRPLFYSLLPNGSFRFATNTLEILADPDVSRTPDDAGVVDFLISRSVLLPGKSPWQSVQRLEAGQSLTFDRSGLHVSRYRSVYDAAAPSFSNQAEAVETCAVALQAAVRHRVQGARRCGISLSGGWDSGAVFAVLQWMRGADRSLPEPWFYTYYGDSPEADERAEVRELLSRWPATGEFVHLDAGGGLDGLDAHCAQMGMPEPASGWRWVAECAAAARAAGVTHLLTGEAGNEVFQSSIMRPVDLLRSGQIRDAYRQVQSWARDAETSTRSFLLPFVVRPALAACLPNVWNSLRRARRLSGMRSGALSYLTDSARELALDLTSQADARNQRHLKGRPISSWDKRVALDRWCSDLFPMPAGPELDGVTLTAPYLDRRVVTSALAALELESGPGSTRRLLASTVEFTTGHAFQGRHAHYTDLLDRMLRGALETSSGLFEASRLVEMGVVDPIRLKRFVDCFRAGDGVSLGMLWRLVSAEVWARRFIT